MIPRDTLFRTVSEANGRFDVEGQPDFRMQTSTWIQQDIRLEYRDESEPAIPLWAGTGIEAYQDTKAAFLPQTFYGEVLDALPLNRTFEDVRFKASGNEECIEINTEDQLELRKLLCQGPSRAALERVEFPNPKDLSTYEWLDGETGQYVNYSDVVDVWRGGAAAKERGGDDC